MSVNCKANAHMSQIATLSAFPSSAKKSAKNRSSESGRLSDRGNEDSKGEKGRRSSCGVPAAKEKASTALSQTQHSLGIICCNDGYLHAARGGENHSPLEGNCRCWTFRRTSYDSRCIRRLQFSFLSAPVFRTRFRDGAISATRRQLLSSWCERLLLFVRHALPR